MGSLQQVILLNDIDLNESQTNSSICILLIFCVHDSVLDYALLDLEIPTITIVGKLIKAGISVLVYRYMHASQSLTSYFYAFRQHRNTLNSSKGHGRSLNFELF